MSVRSRPRRAPDALLACLFTAIGLAILSVVPATGAAPVEHTYPAIPSVQAARRVVERLFSVRLLQLRTCRREHPRRCAAARRSVRDVRSLLSRSAHLSAYSSGHVPVLTVSGNSLRWTSVGSRWFVLARKVPGRSDGYSVVHGTADSPPAVPGATVRYSVRPYAYYNDWARDVSIAYPISGSAPSAGHLPGATSGAGNAKGSGGGPGGGPSGGGGTPPPAEPLRLFSAESVFNKQLPASVPLASNSAQLVGNFASQVARYYGHVVINTTSWSAPVYVVGPSQPTVALAGKSSICPRPEGVWSAFQEQIEAVPLPANALPAAGADKEVIVWQPATGHLWELWRVLQEGGRWTACWGARVADAHTSNGVFPAPFGAGASGLSLLGGQIHLEDLEHGAINHALEVLMPDTANGTFVWPADRTDGTSTAADAIPEGTHFRLNPNLNLGALHLSPAALEIATAIQRYGLIVGDTAGAVALSAQDTTPIIREGKPNPYNVLLPNHYEALNAVPWSQLEVVSPSYRG